MPLDVAAIEAAVREHATSQWIQTQAAVKQFSEEAENKMKAAAPKDTRNLEEEISSKMTSTGSVLTSTIIVTTEIGDGLNPINSVPASTYGYYQNYGFINSRTHQHVKGYYFMETAESAFFELVPILQAIW
jgi:adenosyl cobinamide kinase/adenosyl cobinamide phosphate guanylyltransferase